MDQECECCGIPPINWDCVVPTPMPGDAGECCPLFPETATLTYTDPTNGLEISIEMGAQQAKERFHELTGRRV